jgi:hypothetical protein
MLLAERDPGRHQALITERDRAFRRKHAKVIEALNDGATRHIARWLERHPEIAIRESTLPEGHLSVWLTFRLDHPQPPLSAAFAFGKRSLAALVKSFDVPGQARGD